MATNHTDNYRLNLWASGDDFLREEFNENSEKVDAALGGLAEEIVEVNPVERLGAQTLAAPAARVDVDLSGVDWDRYREVQVWYRIATGDTCTYSAKLDNSTLLTLGGHNGSQHVGTFRFMRGTSMLCIAEIPNFTGTVSPRVEAVTCSATAPVTLNFTRVTSNNGPIIFQAGSEFRVYGLKK